MGGGAGLSEVLVHDGRSIQVLPGSSASRWRTGVSQRPSNVERGLRRATAASGGPDTTERVGRSAGASWRHRGLPLTMSEPHDLAGLFHSLSPDAQAAALVFCGWRRWRSCEESPSSRSTSMRGLARAPDSRRRGLRGLPCAARGRPALRGDPVHARPQAAAGGPPRGRPGSARRRPDSAAGRGVRPCLTTDLEGPQRRCIARSSRTRWSRRGPFRNPRQRPDRLANR